MNIRQLRAALKSLNPDTEIFFTPENGVPIMVAGGVMIDHRDAPGGKVLNLAPTKLDKVGGF